MMSDFSKIRSHEDECIRFGKLFAELYYYMAKNIIDKLGEKEGSQIIKDGLKEFAEYRVSNMKEEAKERDIEIKNIKDYFKVRDMPDCGWENGEERGVVVQCLFDEVWKKYGETGKKLQKLYCDIDYILYGGFGFHLDRPSCKANGDDECVFHLTQEN
jgi:predicted hydrocarbon binding protein